MLVHQYNYKPEWNRHLARGCGPKAGRPLLGVELEMVFRNGDGCRAFVEALEEAGFGDEKKVVLKKDGSLPGEWPDGDVYPEDIPDTSEPIGLEVVFHPHHFPRLSETLSRVAALARKNGAYTSHEDAGLHTHVARKGMGLGAQGALVYLVNKFTDRELSTLFGRGDGEYTHRQDEAVSRPVWALGRSSHYHRVDSRREETLELRCSESTLKLDTLQARVQAAEVLAAYALSHPITFASAKMSKDERDAVYGLPAVLEFAKNSRKYPEFCSYHGLSV